MNKTLHIDAKDCPVTREADVVVCGGGPGGIGAAVAAARLGAKVVIIERFGALGGLTTTGLVTTCMSGVALSGDKVLIKGVFETMVDKCVERQGAIRAWELAHSDKYFVHDTSRCEIDQQIWPFEPEVYKLCAEELMVQYDIEVMYYTLITGAVMEGGRIKGLIAENKSGTQAILGKQFIDATGDASVARFAGAKCTLANGEKTPMTLMFHFGGARDVVASYRPNVSEVPYGAVNFFPMMRPGEFRAEMTRHVGCTTNGDDLTRATLACRKQVPEVIEYMRKNVPGCEDIYLIQSGSVIATLATPRIAGIDSLSEEHIFGLRMPEDRIALTAYGIDVHSDKEGGQNELHWLKPGLFYGVPYGILVPKSPVDNLLAAGRVVSADYRAATAVACSGICMATGEAAGTAAWLSIRQSKAPRDLDVKKVQELLVENGAILDPVPAPDPGLDRSYEAVTGKQKIMIQ